MGYTIAQYLTLHGKALVDCMNAQDATIVTMSCDRSARIYNLPVDVSGHPDETQLTEDQKELIALDALTGMLCNLQTEHGTSGAVQKIVMGTDGVPEITFFDRLKQFTSFRDKLIETLELQQARLGYMTYLNPQSIAHFSVYKVEK